MQEQIETVQLSTGVSPASSAQMKAPSERAPRGKYAGGVLERSRCRSDDIYRTECRRSGNCIENRFEEFTVSLKAYSNYLC